MTIPTHETAAGSVYLQLQKLARRDQRPTDELLVLYVLEGFLDRLSSSPYATRFVLKGGVLLAAFGARRPTRDIDFQASSTAMDTQTMTQMVKDVVSIERHDGILYDVSALAIQPIRDTDSYPGCRLTFEATLSRARLKFHIDVNVGDPIVPDPTRVQLPRLLGGFVELQAYPLSMVIAEKLVTALERGTANTRWRDFADMYSLSRQHRLARKDLNDALTVVARYRGIALEPLSKSLEGYPALAQRKWAAWRKKQRLEATLPESLADVLHQVAEFSDSVLAGETGGDAWHPDSRRWG